ncbi:MAG TPA: hypothetical protein VF411_14815, partial [Bacteroidia bacterium]
MKHLFIILISALSISFYGQSQTSINDSSLVKLIGWVPFKTYSKKEKPRIIYLLKGNDTLKIYNDRQDYSDGGIRNGMFWRAFIYDSVEFTENLVLYIKKTSVSEKGDVFLFNRIHTKKLAKFTELSDGYKC